MGSHSRVDEKPVKDMPFEPPSDLRQWGKVMHDMFLALVDGGFTEDQAFKFLANWMVANGGSNDDKS